MYMQALGKTGTAAADDEDDDVEKLCEYLQFSHIHTCSNTVSLDLEVYTNVQDTCTCTCMCTHTQMYMYIVVYCGLLHVQC